MTLLTLAAIQQWHSVSIHPAIIAQLQRASQAPGDDHLHFAIPPPVVADIDGDGTKEILIATFEPKIKLVAPGHSRNIPFVVKHTASLEATFIPVALSAGQVQNRKQQVSDSDIFLPGCNLAEQMIVVMSEDWMVIGLDHNLQWMWTQNLLSLVGQQYSDHLVHKYVQCSFRMVGFSPSFREAAILMPSQDPGAPAFVRELVIIAGSRDLRANVLQAQLNRVSAHPSAASTEGGAQVGAWMQRMAEGLHDSANTAEWGNDDWATTGHASAQELHFSLFALNVSTGSLVWSHRSDSRQSELADGYQWKTKVWGQCCA